MKSLAVLSIIAVSSVSQAFAGSCHVRPICPPEPCHVRPVCKVVLPPPPVKHCYVRPLPPVPRCSINVCPTPQPACRITCTPVHQPEPCRITCLPAGPPLCQVPHRSTCRIRVCEEPVAHVPLTNNPYSEPAQYAPDAPIAPSVPEPPVLAPELPLNQEVSQIGSGLSLPQGNGALSVSGL